MAERSFPGADYTLSGRVQGVGLRPALFRLAQSLGLSGRLWNEGARARLQLWGPADRLETFRRCLPEALPAAARLDDLRVAPLSPGKAPWHQGLTVEAGRFQTEGGLPLPDRALCARCRSDLLEGPLAFRGYAHLGCTDCGARQAVFIDWPWQREHTSLSGFAWCPECRHRFNDPDDRRFHAENLVCARCGPRSWLAWPNAPETDPLPQTDIWATAARALQSGQILTLMGLSGTHLLCDTRNLSAVQSLRARKRRPAQPLAILVADEEALRQVLPGVLESLPQPRGVIDSLSSPTGPIVVLPVDPALRPPWMEACAPGLDRLGVMFASSGQQLCLLQAWQQQCPLPAVLVCTSANLHGAPMPITVAEARATLGPLSDLAVLHDRPIRQGADDSVLIAQGAAAPQVVRVGRGLAPLPINCPASDMSVVLALGGYLKNTFCLTQGSKAWLSPHIGDLDHPDTCDRLEQTVLQWLQWARCRPDHLVSDLDPDSHAYRLAERWSHEWQIPWTRVQHHQAHLGSVLIETPDLIGKTVLGVALDGHGLGSDHQPWGGELLRGQGLDWQRLGHLATLPLPGGDLASRDLDRLIIGFALQQEWPALLEATLQRRPDLACLAQVDWRYWPQTSSCGRWFDLAAAVLGVCRTNTYEGEAAQRLEALAGAPPPKGVATDYRMADGRVIRGTDGRLDPAPLIRYLVEQPSPHSARLFHATLCAGLCDWIRDAANRHGHQAIVLSGGCLLNHWLADYLPRLLAPLGIQAYRNQQVPCTDAGLALGQAWCVISSGRC